MHELQGDFLLSRLPVIKVPALVHFQIFHRHPEFQWSSSVLTFQNKVYGCRDRSSAN